MRDRAATSYKTEQLQPPTLGVSGGEPGRSDRVQEVQSGLKVTTGSRKVALGIDALTAELLCYGTGAGAFFSAREDDPECVLANALCAALHLFTMTRTGAARAEPFLAAMCAHKGRCSAREALFADAVLAWARDDQAGAIARHWEIARRWPEDLLSAKIAQFHQLNSGDFPGMLALVETIMPAHPGNGFVNGMRAFALEQCGREREAEAEGRLACSLGFDPWAQHAVAHVLDTEGRAAEGRDWLAGHAEGWEACSSFLYTHNWWHLALFDLDLGDATSALRIMDEHVWARRRDYCQDQINAISLLARLELCGVDVGDRWAGIGNLLEDRTGDHVNGFLDLHYAYALARADRSGDLAEFLRTLTEKAAGDARPCWRETAPLAADGVIAHARGQYGLAVSRLRQSLPGLHELGGSNTQRDLLELLYLDSLIGSRALGEAEVVLQRRVARRGIGAWHRRALSDVRRAA